MVKRHHASILHRYGDMAPQMFHFSLQNQKSCSIIADVSSTDAIALYIYSRLSICGRPAFLLLLRHTQTHYQMNPDIQPPAIWTALRGFYTTILRDQRFNVMQCIHLFFT